MGLKGIILLFTLCSLPTYAIESLRSLSASEKAVEKDLKQILKKGELTGFINVEHLYRFGDYTRVSCFQGKITLKVYSLSKEWSSTFYYALQKLGFLFPHPRWQITPTKKEMYRQCGKKIYWKPALKYRGFHLHTLHPSEWVQGFLEGETPIALDTVRWLARNQQNIFDLSLLRMPHDKIYKNLKEPFRLAKELGIHAGVTFGMAFHQQNSFKLVSVLGAFSDSLSRKEISRNLNKLLDNLDISFINVESGTSEFTPVNYERTIKWLNHIARLAKKKNVRMVTKVHISSNQKNKKYGNFNFLPSFANKNVGILPHTVFYYGLNDEQAPMYGNENFKHMRDYLLQEKSKRRTWYYPETSYWVGLDIDIPLLLLEYLRTRAQDMQFLAENKVEGQLNFTTGQELGFWLLDWTVALLNNSDYEFDPMIGLKLLKEDSKAFQKHLDFQKKYFTDKQLIALLTFPNLGDELFPEHSIHQRKLLKNLVGKEEEIQRQIYLLASALGEIPETADIKNEELKTLLDITYARISHALYVRKAMLKNKDKNLEQARLVRENSLDKVKVVIEKFNRYPEGKVFEEHSNPTAYQWGYGHTAKNLYFWEREEGKVRENSFGPFFMNIYDIFDIVF